MCGWNVLRAYPNPPLQWLANVSTIIFSLQMQKPSDWHLSFHYLPAAFQRQKILFMPEPHERFTIKTIFRPWQRQLRVPYPENQIYQHRIRLRLTIYGARHNHEQPTTLSYFIIKFWKKISSSRCHSHEGWRNLLFQTKCMNWKRKTNFWNQPAISSTSQQLHYHEDGYYTPWPVNR